MSSRGGRQGGRRAWKYTAGRRPHRVTVYERKGGASITIYGAVWDPTRERYVRRSLGHDDRDRAIAWGDAQAAKLREGSEELRNDRVTLGWIFDLFLRHRSAGKREKARAADQRAAKMWDRVLGRSRDPHTVSLRDWQSFIAARTSGAVNVAGQVVPEPERRPVRARTVEGDCKWLASVFRWAVQWRTPAGHYLMRDNPVRGFDTPREKNPRRPIATRDRFEALRSKSDRHTMRVRWGPRRRDQVRRSHLSELLDLAAGTGRRIGSICALRFCDLNLAATKTAPYGSITWRADADKTGCETVVPIGPEVRRALDCVMQERPGVGAAQLFPKPSDASKPITAYLAYKWLREGEKLVGLKHQAGGGWHGFRRMWATERKHLPPQDVAKAGGWKTVGMVTELYQRADEVTMLAVVLDRGELREAK